MQNTGVRKEIDLKIAFVGGASIGAKSSFIVRYVKNEFTDSSIPVMTAAFYTKSIISRGKNVKLALWDIGGQERFLSLLPMFLKGADGIVVGYDIANRESFETARRRYMKLKTEYPDATIMVVGNKVDLYDCRSVSWDEGNELAKEFGTELFFETSAKIGYNVNKAMEVFVDKILEKKGY